MTLFLSVLVELFLALSAITWIVAAVRLGSKQPLLRIEARRAVPWTLLDLCLAVLVWLFTTVIFLKLGSTFHLYSDLSVKDASAGDLIWTLRVSDAAKIVSLVGISAWLYWVHRTGHRDLGFSMRRGAYDVYAGLATFFLLAPLAYLLQFFLARFSNEVHPLIEAIREHHSMELFLTIVVSAVVVAPIVEEYAFRVLLQGWLEKTVDRFAARFQATDDQPSAEQTTMKGASGRRRLFRPRLGNRWFVAVGGSSLLFALAHLGHGPAPIPLFLFALGLGHLYYCTHRIWPCILMHSALNACSTLILYVHVFHPEAIKA